MKSKAMEQHFHILARQRETFYAEINISEKAAWEPLQAGKWSIAETMYHLVLLARLFRRFSGFYVPVMIPLARLKKNKPYQTMIHDIYIEYKQKKGRPMPAPFLLKPSSHLQERMTFREIVDALGRETHKLKADILNITEVTAGHVYYPDPIAHYPNLIQCTHLLAIHEQHHFNITRNYMGLV